MKMNKCYIEYTKTIKIPIDVNEAEDNTVLEEIIRAIHLLY